jgi:exodeoxyribonuclease-5
MAKTKTKKRAPVDTNSLNTDQRLAFERLLTYILDKDDHRIFVLKGWAGTGKTFCISLLVNYILDEVYPNKDWYKIAVTGPTNKSVRVIKQASGLYNPRLSFQTIHKLLGLKERITMDGRQEFVADHDGGFKPAINSTKLLIIDEVSMLNDDLFEKIVERREKTKIICMGDPAQIPPVGRPDCIPFMDELLEEYRIKTLQLNTIMRQKLDNPIIASSVLIRENIGSAKSLVELENKVNSNGEGIEFININDVEVRKSFSDLLARYFKTEEFKKNSEYCKIIAWRNKTVSTMNGIVRKVIYGEESLNSKILIGEKLIANNPIIWQSEILFNTNDEFTVKDFKIKTSKVSVDQQVVELKYYETEVIYLDDNSEECQEVIDILHESSQFDFQKAANFLKTEAIAKKGKDKSWIAYYDFLRTYADVSYSYSITAHKSQGSTYTITFLSEDDIDLNKDVIERNRIKYTAYTRASKKLYVIKRF